MNYVAVGIITLTIVPIIFGILLGILRGWRRSLLRFGLVIVSLVLAFALCGVVGHAIMNMQIPSAGMTVNEFIVQSITEATQGVDISTISTALAESLIKITVFLLLFGLIMFVTWAIVYPICKIFVKPYKDSDGNIKKRRLIGAGIGAVQGLIVGVMVCIVFSGLSLQAGRIGNVVNQLAELEGNLQTDQGGAQTLSDSAVGEQSDPTAQLDTEIFQVFIDYADTSTCKFYSVFNEPFNWLSQVDITHEDGTSRKITLSGTIDAVDGVVKMAKEVVNLQGVLENIDLENIHQAEDKVDLKEMKDIFKNMDIINENLSPEAKETIKETLDSISDSFDLPVDLDFGSIDLDNVKFEHEGEIVEDLINFSKKESLDQDETTEVVQDILDSTLAIPVLQGSDINCQEFLLDYQREMVEVALQEIEAEGSVDQSKIDALRELLGL